ncbi:AT-rich interactive domain-containing protein 4A [Aplochiton taeniatus]
MKAVDEPAYLTVGTDVSAKYRGAFCEAKIKTVKRMVKVKVTLKGETTSQVVQDDQVKGPLRVGSTVEVKTNEGVSSEGVIGKLTDASWYTVVFDDGDEKTLRRTSLCLKGERHFAESETLDQLPLTNPEHFGTPVIGKKSNRGGRRSSQAQAEDEKESSSSDDEEEDKRRLNDDLLGKVSSIQAGTDKTSWYLALVVSPSCNDDLTVKKDQCLVRSFADSKFYIVARKDVHGVNMDSIAKPDFSSRKGVEGAIYLLKTKQVPEGWKMDMSEILESSSSDEEDAEGKESEEEEEDRDEDEEEEEEDKKKKKKTVKEEPDDEPDPEERDYFLQQLYKFMEDRGTPINKPPVLGYKDLNLFKLFRLVYHQGGCHNIESGTVWKQIYMDLGIPVLNSAASYNVKTAYRKYLYGFEEYCRSALIQFRTIHHNEPRPVAAPPSQKAAEPKEISPIKTEPAVPEEKAAAEEVESESESDKDGQKETHTSPRGRRKCVLTPGKIEDKEPVAKLEKIKEEKPKEESHLGEESISEEQKERPDMMGDTPGRRRSNRHMEDKEYSDKESEDEEEEDDEEEDEDEDRRNREREDEEDEDSVTGTKVRVKYGRGKTQKIYEANIKKTDTDDGDQLYLVHYYGWNVRYDEWVKADRIIWPGDKGGTKKKQKKKVKNKDKDDGDKEEDKQAKLGLKRGRPSVRTTPPSSTRSVSKTPSGEGRSSSKSSRPSDTSSMANGDGTPRRRTRRTSGMYDSDRASNEESGNSSEDSESEDCPEKKPAWAERTDPATARKLEEEEDRRVERVRVEAAAVAAAAAAAATASAAAAANAAVAMATSPQPPAVAPPCPSMPQEQGDNLLQLPERREPEKGEEPPAAAMSPVPDKQLSPAQEKVNKMSPLPDRLHRMSPAQEKLKMSPVQDKATVSPVPDKQHKKSPIPDKVKEEESRSPVSPRGKGRRSILREPGSETPPTNIQITTMTTSTTPNHAEAQSSPPCPRNLLKRQDDPKVVLHPLPSQHLPPEPCGDSDTDSATEEESCYREERSVVTKRKATEQRTPDKKVRLDRREEAKTASPKTTISSPKTAMTSPTKRAEAERRSEAAMKGEERLRKTEEKQDRIEDRLLAATEPDETIEMPALTPEIQRCLGEKVSGVGSTTELHQQDQGPAAEELMPQIGPEALVCHEVDLDDLDEKEKPEELLMMMREQKIHQQPHHQTSSAVPHPPHHSQPQTRAFPSASVPNSSPSLEESHSTRSESDATIEVDSVPCSGESQEGLGENESNHGFDASTSSSNSSLSLQETKDRGQKRLMDCNSSTSAKKQKRNQKRPSTTAKSEKNGAGHSSDSEDLSVMDTPNKLSPVKHPVSKGHKLARSPGHGLASPHSKDHDKEKHKDKQGFPSPQRTYKWTFPHNELDSMSSGERISFLQDKLQEIRKYYMSLKSEVASIDRRRKRIKKKEREVSHTTASTSSGSSDTGMSPSSASPTQNTVAVECR